MKNRIIDWLKNIDKKFYKSLFVIALPAAFQGLIKLSVNLLDNVMVGSLGDIALSSTALGNQFTVLLSFLITGIGGGSAVLISQYLGEKNMVKVKSIFITVLQFTVILIGLIMTFVIMFPTLIMNMFTDKEELIVEGAKFLRIVSFSYIFFAITDCIVSMLRCNKIIKIGFFVSIVSLICNIFFNYILIFGKFGAPVMGIQGAALATVISRIVECTLATVYLLKHDEVLNIRIRELFAVSLGAVKEFVRNALPIVFGDFQWGLVGTVKASLIGHISVTMVAANMISDAVLSLAMIFTNGLAVGATVIIGQAVGSGDYVKTRKYSNRIQILFAIIGVTVAICVISIRFLIPELYNVSAETKALASTFLLIGGITHIGTCYHAACFVGINRGSGDGKFVMKVDMICGWLVILPLTFITGFVLKLPLPYVYLASRADQCYKWLIAFLRLRGDKWIKNITVK